MKGAGWGTSLDLPTLCVAVPGFPVHLQEGKTRTGRNRGISSSLNWFWFLGTHCYVLDDCCQLACVKLPSPSFQEQGARARNQICVLTGSTKPLPKDTEGGTQISWKPRAFLIALLVQITQWVFLSWCAAALSRLWWAIPVISVLADHTLPWPLYKVEFVTELGRRAFLRAASSFLHSSWGASVLSEKGKDDQPAVPVLNYSMSFILNGVSNVKRSMLTLCWERVPHYWPSLSCSRLDSKQH